MDSIAKTEKSGGQKHTKLNRQQIIGFWAAWWGWTLDGLASFSYALVLAPALTELLPKSGYRATPGNIGLAGSILFALFLVGWGLSFLWGPLADRFGRTKTLAGTIVVYAVFTAAAAFSQTVWQLAIFRLLAGVGIGGEWSLAGTYIAEAWPEDRRKMGAGYLQTGYYFGFFIAAALEYTVGVHFGWRAIFLCNLPPVALALVIAWYVHEPERWQRTEADEHAKHVKVRPMRDIFNPANRLKTIVNTALLTVAIIGLWAGSVYEPTAVIDIAKRVGKTAVEGTKLVSIATALLSVGTILGCLAVPLLCEWWGRKKALAFYFAGMGLSIYYTFGLAFYWRNGLDAFIGGLIVLGFFGGNFAVFTLWLPEQYDTSVRATSFAFATSFGRFLGAGANFAVGAMVHSMGTIGTPVAYTAIAFGVGILIIPFATETRGQTLPN
ncbi:MAG: MFS transporter [Candidatus Acidiferrales bacterium]